MKDILSRSPETLVLQVDGQMIRWVYLKGGAKAREAVSGEMNTAGKSLLELKSSVPAKPARVILLLRRDEILTKVLSLPSSKPQELEGIVKFKLPQELPYDVSEISYSFDVLRTRSNGFADVAVFWLLKKTVEEKLKFIHSLGLEADIALATTQGLLFYYLKLREKNPLPLPADTLLVSFNTHESELLLVESGKLAFSWPFKKSFDLSETGKESWLAEVRNGMAELQKEGYSRPQSCLIAAPRDIPEAWFDALEKCVGVSVKRLPALSQVTVKNESFSLQPFLGAAFADSYRVWDFLPHEVKELRREFELKQKQKRSFTGAAAFMGLTLACLYVHLMTQQTRHNLLLREYNELYPQAKHIIKIAEEMDLLGRLDDRKTVPLEFIASLPPITPPQIILTQLDYDAEEGFRMRGLSDTHQIIADYLKTLKGLPRVNKADFDFSRRKMQEGKESFDFQISVKIDWSVKSASGKEVSGEQRKP